MYVQLGDSLLIPFNTSDATGASVAADSTPIVVIATSSGGVIAYSPTVTHVSLGDYYTVINVTQVNGFAAGNACGVWVHATVGGIAGSTGIHSFIVGLTPVDLSSLPTNASIAAAILDAARGNHITLGSIGEGIALATALAQGNYMIDNVDNVSNPNGPASQRVRCWLSAAAMAAASVGGSGAQGAFAVFQVTTTYTGPNKVASHTVVQQ